METRASDMREARPRQWRRQADPAERMRWRLARDVGSAAANIRTIVDEGDPASTINAVAEREHCDLIVTGFGHDETLGRIFLGSTRSEEHTSELQSLMRISYAVFCLKKKNNTKKRNNTRMI